MINNSWFLSRSKKDVPPCVLFYLEGHHLSMVPRPWPLFSTEAHLLTCTRRRWATTTCISAHGRGAGLASDRVEGALIGPLFWHSPVLKPRLQVLCSRSCRSIFQGFGCGWAQIEDKRYTSE